jgi:hypothetical protein
MTLLILLRNLKNIADQYSFESETSSSSFKFESFRINQENNENDCGCHYGYVILDQKNEIIEYGFSNYPIGPEPFEFLYPRTSPNVYHFNEQCTEKKYAYYSEPVQHQQMFQTNFGDESEFACDISQPVVDCEQPPLFMCSNDPPPPYSMQSNHYTYMYEYSQYPYQSHIT